MILIFKGRKEEKQFEGSLIDLIHSLGLYTQEVVVKVNGKIVPETYEVKSNDVVEIIQVVYD